MMKKEVLTGSLEILLLEDNPADVFFLKRVLDQERMTYKMTVVEKKDDYQNALLQSRPDLILSDHALPGFNSVEAFQIAQRLYPGIPFILVTGSVSEDFAVQCIKSGIDDYILKNSILRLPASIKAVFEKREPKKEMAQVYGDAQLEIIRSEIAIKEKELSENMKWTAKLQRHMCADRKRLGEVFPESFLLAENNGVSRSFFWTGKCFDQHLIACGEVLTEGIGAAMISMLCYHVLQRDTGRLPASAGELLSRLNRELQPLLQDEQFTEPVLNTGICIFNRERTQVEFAGAGMPLLRFSGSEMILSPGSSSGLRADSESRSFQSHNLKMKEGDALYFYSRSAIRIFASEPNASKASFYDAMKSLQTFKMDQQHECLQRKAQNVSSPAANDFLIAGIRI